QFEADQAAGTLTLPDMPKKGQVQGPFTPQDIPEAVRRMQRSYDKLIALDSQSEDLATYRFNAAALSQRYFHFSDAERRFVEIVDRHCDKNVAINAGFAIIDSYVVREDHKATQEWTARLGAKGCGEGELKAKFAGDLKTLGLAARFQEANLLLEAGEYEAAADRYVALVQEEPKDKNADRALNNAAVAYEKIGRFGSAGKTYRRIFNEYPDSEFADDALLRSGLNHVRFFEFEDAVTTYLKLAEDPRYKDSEHRLIALKNAADLLDSLQQYNRSAAMFRKYAEKAEDPAEVADAVFRVATVLRKTDDQRAIEAAYAGFISRYASNEGQADKVVEGHLRIGQSRAVRGDRKGAENAYRDCISTFSARGLKNGSDAADFPSEAQFLLSEYALADLLEFELKGKGKALTKAALKLFDQVVEASKAYDAVIPYRRLEWVLAAMYRRGYAFETTAIKMRKAPVPRSLRPYTEVWFAYKEEVEKGAARFEAMAIPLFEETIKRGKQYGVANEWTRKALERLNVYKPIEYPLLREPAVELQVEDRR
ncbi:MAG: tetratricopeptide repeat protein, partial [Nannocystaceae bacterium]